MVWSYPKFGKRFYYFEVDVENDLNDAIECV